MKMHPRWGKFLHTGRRAVTGVQQTGRRWVSKVMSPGASGAQSDLGLYGNRIKGQYAPGQGTGTAQGTSAMNLLGPFWVAWDTFFLRSNTAYFTLIVVLSFGLEGVTDRIRDTLWYSRNKGKMFHDIIKNECYAPYVEEDEDEDDEDDDDE